MHLIVAGLGNVPVLAEEAAHIAPGGAHAEDVCAGQEVIQGFLLDGIDLQRGGRAVAQAVELSAFIDANETESRLSRVDVAMARTKIAVSTAVGLRFPQACFGYSIGSLEDI